MVFTFARPMRRLVSGSVLLVVLAVGGYFTWKAYNKPPPPPPPPAPVVERATPRPVVDRRHLAPDGVFYTLRYLSVTTDSSIAGIPPGTGVVRLSQDANRLRVRTNDGIEFTADLKDLTNDLDVAARVATNDKASQNHAADAASGARSAEAKRKLEDEQLRQSASGGPKKP